MSCMPFCNRLAVHGLSITQIQSRKSFLSPHFEKLPFALFSYPFFRGASDRLMNFLLFGIIDLNMFRLALHMTHP